MRLIFHLTQLAALDRKAQGISSEIKAQGETKGNMIYVERLKYRKIREKHGLPVGLGDTIAKIAKAVGIKQCNGCRKRQAKLNKLVPY